MKSSSVVCTSEQVYAWGQLYIILWIQDKLSVHHVSCCQRSYILISLLVAQTTYLFYYRNNYFIWFLDHNNIENKNMYYRI